MQHQCLSDDTLVGGGTIPTHVFNQKHPIFVQNLAQNWRKRKNHLPEIRVSG